MGVMPRRKVHERKILCEAFIRDDGLLEIEAMLQDTKPHTVHLTEGRLEAGQPLHQMRLRIAVDADFMVHEAQAQTIHSPYGICGGITPSYGALVGMRIGPGFLQEARKMLRGPLGCTHITELLPVVATTVFQASSALHAEADEGDQPAHVRRANALGRCHALRLDGDVVHRDFPDHATDATFPNQPSPAPTES